MDETQDTTIATGTDLENVLRNAGVVMSEVCDEDAKTKPYRLINDSFCQILADVIKYAA